MLQLALAFWNYFYLCLSIGVSINEWSIQIFKESIQTIMSSSVDMYPKVKYFHLQEETLSGYNSCYSVSQKQFLESGCKSGVQTSYLASDIRSEMAMGLKTIFYDVFQWREQSRRNNFVNAGNYSVFHATTISTIVGFQWQWHTYSVIDIWP